MFGGWLRENGQPDAVRVQIAYAGETIAEAMACLFRRDLLAAEYGHGYHGFQARLMRPLPPGPGALTIQLPGSGAMMAVQVDVPELEPPACERVEDMLRQPPGWTVEDVAGHPGCLRPEDNYARLGPARFTDAVFRFVYGRWPTAAEGQLNIDSLAADRITPRALLLECLASRERAESPAGLPGPFDPAFPFILAAQTGLP